MRIAFAAVALLLSGSAFGQQSGWPPAPGHTVLTVWPGVAPDATPGGRSGTGHFKAE